MAGHALSRRNVTWIGEAGVALVLGCLVGAAVLSPLVATHGAFASHLGFSKPLFFLAILPPIIFEAGWSMDVERFFANSGAIACFAFLGTLISTFFIAAIVWTAGAAGACAPLSPLEALLFGSITSATDPVTVLAVFQRLGANADLFSLVLGESLLNDAVAMVLFRALAGFVHAPVTAGGVARASALFVAVFLGSLAVGAGVAFAAAATLKRGYFRSDHAPLEACLVALFGFSSYWAADALRLSGIVSVLFCGITAAHYVRPNLSARGQEHVGAFFKLCSALAETSVFLFVGESLFLDQQALSWQLVPLLLVCCVALAAARAANIWPCAALVNFLRLPAARIPQAHQFMLWWAGLRGAMAFAIALEAAEALPGQRGEVLLSLTYFLILATVLTNGGGCAYLLERLGLREGAQAHGAAGPPAKQRLLELPGSPRPEACIPALLDPEAPALENTWQDTTLGAAAASPPPVQPPAQTAPKSNPLARSVERLRVANSSGGVLSKLEKLDRRYLGPLFLAADGRPAGPAAAQLSGHAGGSGGGNALPDAPGAGAS